MSHETAGGKSSMSDCEWWKQSDLGECPITLEDISTLSYPPFLLRQNYFDGFALASFIVSRGIFQNPLTREELTVQDCRRLDEYLEQYCYNDDNTSNILLSGATKRRQKVSVTEAFFLRNSVHVETSASGAAVEALRSAATSALIGLFIYGNNRSSQQQQQDEGSEHQMDPLLLDWGFDLSRTVENTAQQGGHGYMVIDDDEANVVASQQFAYETVQHSFPPLHDGYDGRTITNAAATPDEQFLDHVRSLSLQEQQNHQQRLQRLRIAREKLLREALNRRDERRRQRQLEFAQNKKNYQRQKEEETEIAEARAEIEAWREEQWEKLRLLSEQQQQKQTEEERRTRERTTPTMGGDIDQSKDTNVVDSNCGTEEELAYQRKKAKAAAKRKRARERQKMEKATEREEREREERRNALENQKKASALKCEACGAGILDCGFEKFGRRFCSPKCARFATKTG
ncbi:hypothetical protein IV203_007140 [Nitzschia inconspicua]|uniref:FCS-type domain-containing protein n=1 Tax=Nitzschia inconspicua TaxID=303405 RepID=A0A9K3KFD7_9STRA|nr:hypothetical protein IV203_007140 [Nitzschia inconspicua]